jgi:hypothetical protein
MQVQTILDQIDIGAMALPEFQRGYVWNREQVRGLMCPPNRKHPVGSLLVWGTKTENACVFIGCGYAATAAARLLFNGSISGQRFLRRFGCAYRCTSPSLQNHIHVSSISGIGGTKMTVPSLPRVSSTR